MSRSLIGITYKKLLVEAKMMDADAARRGLLCASAQQFYDHYTNQWSSVDSHQEHKAPVSEADYMDDRKLIDPLVRELNSNRDWYHPPLTTATQSFPPMKQQPTTTQTTYNPSSATYNPSSSSTADGEGGTKNDSDQINATEFDEPLTVTQLVRREFRKSPGNLSASFTALKQLSNIGALCADRVPREPLVSAKGYGFEVVDGRTKKNLELAMRDPSSGQALAAVVRQRQMTVITSHPVLHGFFRHSMILLSGCSRNGSVGFIVNKPLTFQGMCVPVWSVIGANFHPLFSTHLSQNPVMLGGPVASPASRQQALYILHRVPNVSGACQIAPNLWMSGDYDQLNEKLNNKEIDASRIMVMMGYSGWGVSQLEGEIVAGSWVTSVKRPILPISEQSAAVAAASELEARDKKKAKEDVGKTTTAAATGVVDLGGGAADDATSKTKGEQEEGVDEEKKSSSSLPSGEKKRLRSAYDIFKTGPEQEGEEEEGEDEEDDDDDDDDIPKSVETEEEIEQRRERHLELVRHPVDEMEAEKCADLIFSTHDQCFKMVKKQNLGEDHDQEGEEGESGGGSQEKGVNKKKADDAAAAAVAAEKEDSQIRDDSKLTDTEKSAILAMKASARKIKTSGASWDRIEEFFGKAQERDREASAQAAGGAAQGVAAPPPKKPEELGKEAWVGVMGGLGPEYQALTRLCNLSSDLFQE